MINRFIILLFICIVSLRLTAFSQSIEMLENRYNYLSGVYEKDSKTLDSLKTILEARAKQIESERQKQSPEDEKIVKLLAGSVSLSNSINNYQEKIETDDIKLKELSKILEGKYSNKIDSLKILKKSANENSEKLDNEILFYTEKRLTISPQVDLLSFNPKKILAVDLNKAKTREEKSILKEYINSALDEVNTLLTDINKQVKEADDAMALRKKASKFLTESEFDRDVRLGNISTTSAEGLNTSAGTGTPFDSRFADKINSYTLLINQLNIFDKPETNNQNINTLQPSIKNLSWKQYSNLLRELLRKLNDYKLVLSNKVEQTR